jgi:hypothetical protein
MNPATAPHAGPQPTRWDTFRARFMFLLAFVFLLVVAGVLHRATSKEVTLPELTAMYVGLVALWPVFTVEAVWGVLRRDRTKPRGPVIWRALLVCVLPPWRMALVDPRTGLVWVPRMGWQQPGRDLFKRLELLFSGPMLVFAFLILPVLGTEYFWPESEPKPWELVLALDISIAIIWVAFATEFVFKASVHPKPFRFATEHWLDAAIVLLPMLEFVLTQWADAAPLARLLRLGRAMRPDQLARLQRLYRLRGVAAKGWRALMVLEALARLFGQTPQKRLAKLEEQITELEEELAELRKDAETTRALIDSPTPAPEDQNQPEVISGGRTGEPSGDVVTASSRPSGP